jgi:hypothetical protein
VLGSHKPQFSLIGDAVNTTSRVCSKGMENQIHISKVTHAALQKVTDIYTYTERKTFMKGLGEQDTYLVGKRRQMKSAQNARGISILRSQGPPGARASQPPSTHSEEEYQDEDDNMSMMASNLEAPSETDSNMIQDSEDELPFSHSVEGVDSDEEAVLNSKI